MTLLRKRHLSFGLVLSTALPLLVACSASPRDGDDALSESGDALTASWFNKNIPPGSKLEKAVLALANDKAMSVDDYVDTCSFSRAVSAALVDYRQGDEPADVSDDETFDDIKEIDRVPFTGSGFWVAAIQCAKDHYMGPGGVCATGTSTLQQTPVAIEFVLDGSGSMDSDDKWAAATGALTEVFNAQTAKGDATTGMGLIVFSDSKDPQGSSTAPVYPSSVDVGVAAVDATQSQALAARLANAQPSGGTPLYEATTGAYTYLSSFNPTGSLSGASKAIVLLTDGLPNDKASDLVKYVEAHKAEAQLFAVGIGPLGNSFSYDPAYMGSLAVAGGTRSSPTCDPTEKLNEANMCHFQVTPKAKPASQIKDELLQAIGTVRKAIAACDIGLQSAGTGTLDPAAVKVVMKDSSGNETDVAKDAKDGWSLDDDQAPTKVLLRGAACDTLRADATKSVRVEVACE